MNFMLDSYSFGEALIKVVGVGGGGCNAVNSMIQTGISGVEYIAMNTDSMSLNGSKAPQKIQLGEKLTRGFGAGSDPNVGKRAAEESHDEIENALRGAQMVFITAGMGGGTGTGAAPVVAEIAHQLDILTVGVVTKPFAFERRRKMEIAEAGIAELVKVVDSLIVIPNERLKYYSEERITVLNAFDVANDVLRQAVRSISDLLTVPGVINLDFMDIQRVMKGAGYAHMGIARASGADKAEAAAAAAIHSPLLETSINGAERMLINLTSAPDVDLVDIDLLINKITEVAHPDALVIWGQAVDEKLADEIVISVIATGGIENSSPVVNTAGNSVKSPVVQDTTPVINTPSNDLNIDVLLDLINKNNM